MNHNNGVLLEICKELVRFAPFGELPIEMTRNVFGIIRARLNFDSSILFKIYEHECALWCLILTGIPEEEHGIGQRDLLSSHPDIKNAIKLNTFSRLPTNHPDVQYIQKIIERKNIHRIGYIPIKDGSENQYVIVVDALGTRKIFSADEIAFFENLGAFLPQCIGKDPGQIISAFFNQFQQISKEEIDDLIKNSLMCMISRIRLFSRRVKKILEDGGKDSITLIKALEEIEALEKEENSAEEKVRVFQQNHIFT